MCKESSLLDGVHVLRWANVVLRQGFAGWPPKKKAAGVPDCLPSDPERHEIEPRCEGLEEGDRNAEDPHGLGVWGGLRGFGEEVTVTLLVGPKSVEMDAGGEVVKLTAQTRTEPEHWVQEVKADAAAVTGDGLILTVSRPRKHKGHLVRVEARGGKVGGVYKFRRSSLFKDAGPAKEYISRVIAEYQSFVDQDRCVVRQASNEIGDSVRIILTEA